MMYECVGMCLDDTVSNINHTCVTDSAFRRLCVHLCSHAVTVDSLTNMIVLANIESFDRVFYILCLFFLPLCPIIVERRTSDIY